MFAHTAGLRNSTSRLAPGCDVRADGGYIIWWPAAGLPVLSDAPPAQWPNWLLARLLPPQRATRPEMRHDVDSGKNGDRAYALTALYGAAERVAYAMPGSRNDRLNAECFRLRRLRIGRTDLV